MVDLVDDRASDRGLAEEQPTRTCMSSLTAGPSCRILIGQVRELAAKVTDRETLPPDGEVEFVEHAPDLGRGRSPSCCLDLTLGRVEVEQRVHDPVAAQKF